ncbi:MAG: preprotein translocase subunit YajC [Clostridia bacterium]|nr:preprotein translocase subunit YajC [Clostridia bacterium]
MLNFLTAEATGMGSTVIMLLLMLAIFYFMLIRPESKRKKKDEEMRSSIRNGDEIITIGGICGTVVDVKDDRIVIETSKDQVRLELMKWSVSSNETQAVAQKAKAKKEQEAKAKAKAAKKAEKNQ